MSVGRAIGQSADASRSFSDDAICLGCGGDLGRRTVVRLAHARLVACPECDSWNYFPRPDESGQIALHDDDAYFDLPYFENRRQQASRAEARCRDLFGMMLASGNAPNPSGARTLDIGCGSGDLLDAARRIYGVEPVGVDVAQAAVRYTTEKHIHAIQGTVADLPEEPAFDYIFAIDVIEHVTNPRGMVAEIASRLRPGGMAYVETPNHFSIVYGVGRFLANLTGGRPEAALERLYPPHHIVYLSARSLRAAARDAGLEIQSFRTRRLPMRDIGGSWMLRACLGMLQLVDAVTDRRALSCLLLTKSRQPVVSPSVTEGNRR